MEAWREELYHHGINGMHWGVRHGPPYPLDQKTSQRIQKHGGEKARFSDREYQDYRSGKKKSKGVTKAGTTHRSNFFESRLKEVINASDLDGLKNVAELWMENPDFARTGQNRKRIDAHDMAVVNQDFYKNGEPGVKNNCVLCSNALEMRKRGYDIAAGRSAYGMLNTASQYYWDGAVSYKEKPQNIMSRLDSFGRDGTGEINMRRPDGSGHSVYFMKDKMSDGSYKQMFVDGQIGKAYDSLGSLMQAEGFSNDSFATITRLDNATPNFKHMAEDSVCRMSYVNQDMNRIQNVRSGQMYRTGTVWGG